MASVIRREGYTIDNGGVIRYVNVESSYEEAESICGRRLDRRRNYAIVEGAVCESASWVSACSGCYEGYEVDHGVGMGCHECGFHGRVRTGMWVPLGASSEDEL
jgi:hypothetical protein